MKSAPTYKRPRSTATAYVSPERRAKQDLQHTERLKSRRGLYGRKWSAYRKAFLSQPENALCASCLPRGITKPAEEVDHIVPHCGDAGLFWLKTNHQGLCKGCHSRKTASQDGGFGNRRRPG